MTDPKTGTTGDPETPQATRTADSAPPTRRARLTVTSTAEATWAAAEHDPEPGDSHVEPERRGLIVSSVHRAAAAQTQAAAKLEPVRAAETREATTTSPGSPKGTRGRRLIATVSSVLLVAYGTALAWAVLVVGSGVFNPWPMYITAGVVGAVALVAARPRLVAPLWLSAVFWVCWIATLPLGAYWAPDTKAVSNAQASVYACALAMLALVGLGAARPVAFRWLWLTVVLTTLPLGVREALFGHYLYPWHGVAGAPTAVFVNPNNYATVLVLMVGIALGWMTERIPRAGRWALIGLSAVCVWLIVATTSRGALVGLIVVIACAALLAAERLDLRPRIVASLRSSARRRPWLWAGGGAMAAVAALASALTAMRLVLPGDDETLRSDGLRAEFIAFGLQMWREHPWFGTGAGTFEHLWTSAPGGAGRPSVPPHNAFVEIASENGLVAALPLILLLAMLAWHAARPLVGSITRFVAGLMPESPPAQAARMPETEALALPEPRVTTHGLPRGLDRVGRRYLVVVHLVAFVLAGVVMSSALGWFLWWTMLAAAVVYALPHTTAATRATHATRARQATQATGSGPLHTSASQRGAAEEP